MEEEEERCGIRGGRIETNYGRGRRETRIYRWMNKDGSWRKEMRDAESVVEGQRHMMEEGEE